MAEVARLTITASANTTKAIAGLSKVDQAVKRLNGQTANVNVTADTARAIASLNGVSTRLSRINGNSARTTVTTNTTDADTGIARVSAAMSRVSGRRANVVVTADTARAQIGLAGVSAAMRRVDGQSARTTASTDRTSGGFNRLAGASNTASGGMGRMGRVVLFASLGLTALQPVMVGAVGATVGLAVGLGTASAAAGVFGLAILAAMKNSTAMKASVDRVKTSFAAFGRAVAPIVASPVNTVLRAIAASFMKLVPLVRAVAPVANAVANAFRRWVAVRLDGWVSFLATNGVPALRNFMMAGRNLLAVIGFMVRAFASLGISISASLARATASMRNWAAGGGFQRFAAYVRSQGPAIKAFFHALGGAIRTVAQSMAQLGPVGLSLATVFLRIIASMPPSLVTALVYAYLALKAAMLANAVVTSLYAASMSYLGGVTLLTRLRVIGLTAASIGYRIAAVAISLATRAWAVAQWFLNGSLLASRIRVIGLMVAAAAYRVAAFAIVIATRAWAVAQLLLNGALIAASIRMVALMTASIAYRVAALAISVTTRVWAAAQWLLNAAMYANPIGLLIAGIILLVAAIVWIATKTTWFQTAWTYTWNFIKTVSLAVWNLMKTVFFTVVNALGSKWGWFIALLGPIGWLIALATHWRVVWGAMKTVAFAIWNGLKAGARGLWSFLRMIFFGGLTGIRIAWSASWNWVKNLFLNVANWINARARSFWGFLRTIFGAGLAWIRRIWSISWNWIKNLFLNVANWINARARSFWGFLRSIYNSGTTWIRRIWSASWNWIKNLFLNVANWINARARAFWGYLRSIYNAGTLWIRHIWSASWNWIKNLFLNVANWINARARSFWGYLRGLYNNSLNAIKRGWSIAWNWMKNLVRNVWNWIIGRAHAFAGLMKSIFSRLVGVIRKVWNGLKDIFAKPIKWVIDVVFNKGLVPLWNNTAAKIPGIGKMTKAKGFASGGYTGNGGKNKPKGVVHGGEYVIKKSATQRMERRAPGALKYMNTTGRIPGYSSGGPVGYAAGGKVKGDDDDGGILGDIVDFGKGAVKGAVNMAKGIGNALKDLGEDAIGWSTGMLMMGAGDLFKKAWDVVVNPMKAAIPDGGLSGKKGKNNIMTEGVKKIPDVWRDAIVELIQSKEMSMSGFVPFRAWQEGDGRRVNYRGAAMNYRTMLMVKHAERMTKQAASITQGSWSRGVAASAGTHDGGGVLDIAQTSDKWIKALRGSGFAAWARGAKWGSPSFSPHTHAVAVGDHQLSSGAKAQVAEFMKGGDGLAGNKPDPHAGLFGGGGMGGSGVQRWRALAARAIKMGGLAANQLGPFLKLMQAESGGNPNARNGWDSNARAGMASVGLMQVIPPTFKANHVAGTSWNIMDPRANLAAAARYIKRRYGGRVPGSPYALGGTLDKGMSVVGESGPELINSTRKGRVVPASQFYNLLEGNQAARAGAGGGGAVPIVVNVYGDVNDAAKFQNKVVNAVTEAQRKGRMRK